MRQVWIVDDDEEMNRAIGLMLRMLDCDVLSFHNARSAAQTLLTGKTPQVLILDINLPEVSGLDMLEFLRRRPEWKELPIIMLSSESADSTVDKALLLGCKFIHHETGDHPGTREGNDNSPSKARRY